MTAERAASIKPGGLLPWPDGCASEAWRRGAGCSWSPGEMGSNMTLQIIDHQLRLTHAGHVDSGRRRQAGSLSGLHRWRRQP